MHIDRIGNGPDLVMIHGWAMHADIFAPVVPALSEHYRLHLVDLPGHGRSSDRNAPPGLADLAAEIADLVPDGAAWLGWSLGGLVALRAAVDRPGTVASLVMVAATPRFTRADNWPHGVDQAVFEEFAQDLDTDFNATLQRFLALEAHGSETAREDLRRLREDVFRHGSPDRGALTNGLELLRKTDLTTELATMETPALFIGGRRDRLVPSQGLNHAAEMSPAATARVIPGAGHAPFIGQPGNFSESVKRFLHRPLERAAGE